MVFGVIYWHGRQSEFIYFCSNFFWWVNYQTGVVGIYFSNRLFVDMLKLLGFRTWALNIESDLYFPFDAMTQRWTMEVTSLYRGTTCLSKWMKFKKKGKPVQSCPKPDWTGKARSGSVSGPGSCENPVSGPDQFGLSSLVLDWWTPLL